MTTAPPIPVPDALSVTHEFAAPEGVDIHYVVAGPADGDLVVCLHGFPECWYAWHEQIPALVDAGYRVVAPDLRGANRSGKPAGVGAYHLDDLAGDVVGLVHEMGREQAHVLAHDFGGLVAWHLAHERPALIDRLAVLNCPHLTIYGRHLLSSVEQLRKAWYVFYFQLPWLPEYGLARNDYDVLESLFRDAVASGAITEDDVERYKTAFAREGTPTAMVNWYRALFRSFAAAIVRNRGVPEMPIEDVPTLLCWGERDFALSPSLVEPHREVVADLTIERYPSASHWVQFDARDAVTETLLAFLAAR